MTLPVAIQGHDHPNSGVTDATVSNGSLQVTNVAPKLPDLGSASKLQYFNSLVGSTGSDSGTTSMNVDGSSTAQEFYVGSTADYDIRIMQILIYIEDSSVTNKLFGAIPALTNGFDLNIREDGIDTAVITAAKTTGELLVQTNTVIFAPVGSAAGNVLTDVDAGTNNAAIILHDIGSIVPNGIRIGRGTLDRIIATVNDDLTGLTDFLVRIFGYRHYP